MEGTKNDTDLVIFCHPEAVRSIVGYWSWWLIILLIYLTRSLNTEILYVQTLAQMDFIGTLIQMLDGGINITQKNFISAQNFGMTSFSTRSDPELNFSLFEES